MKCSAFYFIAALLCILETTDHQVIEKEELDHLWDEFKVPNLKLIFILYPNIFPTSKDTTKVTWGITMKSGDRHGKTTCTKSENTIKKQRTEFIRTPSGTII